jgi:hypothetical protein
MDLFHCLTARQSKKELEKTWGKKRRKNNAMEGEGKGAE